VHNSWWWYSARRLRRGGGGRRRRRPDRVRGTRDYRRNEYYNNDIITIIITTTQKSKTIIGLTLPVRWEVFFFFVFRLIFCNFRFRLTKNHSLSFEHAGSSQTQRTKRNIQRASASYYYYYLCRHRGGPVQQ
jgi:hypothetical protein